MSYSEMYDVLLAAFQGPTVSASADPMIRSTAIRRTIQKTLVLSKSEADNVLAALWDILDFGEPIDTLIDRLKQIYSD